MSLLKLYGGDITKVAALMPTAWSGGTMLTGVSGQFKATHRFVPLPGSPDEPKIHEHTWHVTAWFKNNCRGDARIFQTALDIMLARLDGTELPDDLAWGEDIARQIAVLANCQEVEISRPAERIHARWRWDQ